MNVYLVSFVGADRYWIIIREDSWNRIQGGPVTQAMKDDVAVYVHEDDIDETIEILEDYSLPPNDVKMNLPPLAIDDESAVFYSIKDLTNFVNSNNFEIVNETNCHI